MHITYAERKLLNDTLKLIGRNIHSIRLKKNRRTGLKIETIDYYELGRTVMHLPELLKIATALETPLEKLIEDKK